jgi:hypothetical protein
MMIDARGSNGQLLMEVAVVMQCFEHAKANEIKDAVAVCSNCGAALCMDHLVEEVEMIPRTNEQRRLIFCHKCRPNKR